MSNDSTLPGAAPGSAGRDGRENETGRSPGRNLGVKFFALGLLALMLCIPIFAVWLLVKERESNHRMAVREIGRQWGGPQALVGPLLAVPVTVMTPQSTGGTGSDRAPVRQSRILIVAPQTLTVDGTVAPERRRRGIYEAVVYRAQAQIGARFTAPDLGVLAEDVVAVDWARARLVMSVSDPKGMESVSVTIDGTEMAAVRPGLGFPGGAERAGFQLPVDLSDAFAGTSATPLDMSIAIAFKGSQSLSVSPVGGHSTIRLASSWPHPNFSGAFLPSARTIGEAGFEAQWSVPELARSIPQLALAISAHDPLHVFALSTFGVDLYQPVDHYRYVDRAVKYGVLFVALTFLVIFALEVISKGRMHLAHYTMTGLMVIVFYVLLLALAEIIGFAYAYAIAAGATGAVIAGFAATVFAGRMATFAAFGAFIALYGMLFAVLSLEDIALLTGAVFGFVVLTTVMFATRNIDWSGTTVQRQNANG